MYTIIGSSGRDCVLFMFQLHGSKAGLFETNLIWVDQHDSPNHHIGRRTNTILI